MKHKSSVDPVNVMFSILFLYDDRSREAESLNKRSRASFIELNRAATPRGGSTSDDQVQTRDSLIDGEKRSIKKIREDGGQTRLIYRGEAAISRKRRRGGLAKSGKWSSVYKESICTNDSFFFFLD